MQRGIELICCMNKFQWADGGSAVQGMWREAASVPTLCQPRWGAALHQPRQGRLYGGTVSSITPADLYKGSDVASAPQRGRGERRPRAPGAASFAAKVRSRMLTAADIQLVDVEPSAPRMGRRAARRPPATRLPHPFGVRRALSTPDLP